MLTTFIQLSFFLCLKFILSKVEESNIHFISHAKLNTSVQWTLEVMVVIEKNSVDIGI